MIDGRNFFDQSVKNHQKDQTFKNLSWSKWWYTTGCLLDYPYSRKNYKLIALDLSRQQNHDAGPKARQQINFTGSLERDGNTQIFFIIEEAK